MDPNDLFRRFFGFSSRPSHSDDSSEDDQSNFFFPGFGENHSKDDGFQGFFGNHSRGLDGMFEHFHHDMWKQMESLHQQMEDMMKGFGSIDFPRGIELSPLEPIDPKDQEKNKDKGNIFIWSSPPSPFFRSGENNSPRDFMLKDGTDVDDSFKKPSLPALPGPSDKVTPDPSDRVPLGPGDKPLFGKMFSLPHWNRSRPQKLEDSDLDGKISDDKILELIKKPHEEMEAEAGPVNKPRFFSMGKSVSVTTVRGADGKVEQKRTVRDSSGHEESTVTRSLGDKSYTVTTIKGENGKQERHETFHNMDEKDLSAFENQWKNPKQPLSSTDCPNYADSLLAPPFVDAKDKDLFTRLFGWRNK